MMGERGSCSRCLWMVLIGLPLLHSFPWHCFLANTCIHPCFTFASFSVILLREPHASFPFMRWRWWWWKRW